jgi:hypothetical protein
MSVFHLKYRPTKISDIDLVDVAEKLKSESSKTVLFLAFLNF